MSRGIGAHANKVLEDEYVVIYEYEGYNLNEPEYRNADRIYDGTIMIRRECFVKPEIHEKLKILLQELLARRYMRRNSVYKQTRFLKKRKAMRIIKKNMIN